MLGDKLYHLSGLMTMILKIGQSAARLKVNFIGVKSKRPQLRLTH
jgi:hypothetical protein